MNAATPLLDWNAVDTVLLDMDGTLLDLYFDNHFWLEHVPRRYAEHHATTEERARAHLQAVFAEQHGTLNWYCLDYWSRELQLDIAGLKREIQHLIRVRPHVDEFLQRLHASPREVWLVTNAHRDSLDLKLERTGIGRWFDRVICSHDLRAPKEHTVFWQRLQDTHPFAPGRSLLIDDNASVLKSAHQFGIAHLLTLLQPDSRQLRREATEYPGILHFDEIMPIEGAPVR